MKFQFALLVCATACSAASANAPESTTVLVGAYNAVSINGNTLPAPVVVSGDVTKEEIIADRLWIGGTAGRNGVMWRVVTRTTVGGDAHIDSTTVTGTFEATLATAQTTFGPVVASGNSLTFRANDGTTRIYERSN